jgi:hypothetical protein
MDKNEFEKNNNEQCKTESKRINVEWKMYRIVHFAIMLKTYGTRQSKDITTE